MAIFTAATKTIYRMRLISLAAILLMGYFEVLSAQTIPAPGDVLPHEIGETFTPHHMLVDYYQAVAEASPRVQLMEYGRTNEDRPLMLAFVSTPENLAKLDDIRQNNLKRAGMMSGETDPELDLAIVWLSYSVHGNEAAGSEAGMGVLYDLANPDDPRGGEWLKNTLVIMDPSINPDGYNRYSNWYRQVASRMIDPLPSVREHNEPWPGGRTNHYYFDLNRDWAWQTQIESRQRMKEYQRWMPHIHADVHEQGYTSPYYFAPAAKPYHDYITDWQGDFQTEIGQNHARYFDREGWLYFTRERFDLFYPSYGDTYPTFNGAIGMTYEQGGHSRAGRAIDLPTGDTLRLADRVAHHRTTSLSTVEIAHREKDRLVSEFGKYFRESQRNPPGKYKTYVISGDTPRGRLRALTTLLDRNGIEYRTADAEAKVNGFDYGEKTDKTSRVQKGDLIVSAYQPRAVLTQVLFDPDARLEDSVTYDITAWSLPQAYGLNAFATTERLGVETKAFAMEDYVNPLEGVRTEEVYSFIIPWTNFESARFLAAAAKAGLKARTATAAGSIDGKSFPAGSIVINRGDNRTVTDFDGKIAQLVADYEPELLPMMTGFSSQGYDLGSSVYGLVGQPKIATLSGEEFNSNEFGQVWYFFEQDLEYPLHIYHFDDMEDVFADDMDILVLAEGYFRLSDDQRDALRGWIRDGGRLITIGNANRALAGQSGFGLAYKERDEEDEDPLLPYGGSERRYISGYVPGAIVPTEMDDSHPLSFGLGNRYASLKTNSLSFEYLENGDNVGRMRAETEVSGFMGYRAKERLGESLSFGVESMGRGEVVYLVDNPLFRGFWQNGKLLFSNALFQL